MFLVDTNVISAGAPRRVPGWSELVHWMDRNSATLFLSAVTVAEVADGIAKARREGATRKAAALSEWLDTVLHLYRERILTFDVMVARIAGVLSDAARGQGRAPGFADIIIAATARHHGLTILTRNTRHFEPLGVAVFDPFTALPPVQFGE
jgi:predicted nucleic acid-binding protein